MQDEIKGTWVVREEDTMYIHIGIRSNKKVNLMVHYKEGEDICGWVCEHAQLRLPYCGGCYKFPPKSNLSLYRLLKAEPYIKTREPETAQLVRYENGPTKEYWDNIPDGR